MRVAGQAATDDLAEYAVHVGIDGQRAGERATGSETPAGGAIHLARVIRRVDLKGRPVLVVERANVLRRLYGVRPRVAGARGERSSWGRSGSTRSRSRSRLPRRAHTCLSTLSRGRRIRVCVPQLSRRRAAALHHDSVDGHRGHAPAGRPRRDRRRVGQRRTRASRATAPQRRGDRGAVAGADGHPRDRQ